MRKFLTTPEEPENNRPETTRTLRINNPTGIYARRSDPDAKNKSKDQSQSREMQTEDLMIWGIDQGWEEKYLNPYFADLGLSGTLRPDQRPDMLRLFEDIDKGKYNHGSVVCYQENRLFRDDTQIYYNQFIQKCKEHDIVVVVVSPYLMIYDFRDEMLTEMFRWKCKEAGEFIKRHIKGWMHPARDRKARQGKWAGLGDMPIGYIVDFDPKSPTYSKYVPYEPHAKVVKYLYRRLIELCGDLKKLRKELAISPVIFPPFPESMDQRNITKHKIMTISNGVLRTRSALISILTNPVYIGWSVVKGKIEKKDNHESIIDIETFTFAYKCLTGLTLDGEPSDTYKHPKRYYHGTTESYKALLKDRIKSNFGAIYVHSTGHYNRGKASASYIFMTEAIKRQPGFTNEGTIELGRVEVFDTLIINRLFEHIHTIGDLKKYNEGIARKQADKYQVLKSIEDSLKQIPTEQENIATQIGKTDNEDVRDILLKKIEHLAKEKTKLLTAKEKLEHQNEITLQSLEVELSNLENEWSKYPILKRIALVNFLVKEVVIDIMSTHWVHIQVSWVHDQWGKEEIYYCRSKGLCGCWSEKEIAILRKHYPTAEKQKLMELLPNRSWRGIQLSANANNVDYRINGGVGSRVETGNFSFNDLEFMKEHNIALDIKSTKWAPVYQPEGWVV